MSTAERIGLKIWSVVLKIVSTVFAALLAFYLGARVAGFAIVYWINPLNRQDPDYGQLDLPGLFYAACAGGAVALAVVIAGTAWTIKTSLPKRDPNRQSPKTLANC